MTISLGDTCTFRLAGVDRRTGAVHRRRAAQRRPARVRPGRTGGSSTACPRCSTAPRPTGLGLPPGRLSITVRETGLRPLTRRERHRAVVRSSEVVAEHGAVVLRVCRALLGPADADDAWSETFLAALRAYPDLRPDSNVRGWLVTIAHRKAIDQLRRRGRARRARPADVPERPSPADHRRPADDGACAARSTALPAEAAGAPWSTATSPTSRTREVAAPARQQRGRRPPQRRRRHRRAAPPSPRSSHDRIARLGRHPMTSRSIAASPPLGGAVAAGDLAALRARLAARGRARGPRSTSPTATSTARSAPLLVAATPAGVVRVAFAREGHDAVLAGLAARRQPAVLRAPAPARRRRPPARRVLRRPPPRLRRARRPPAGPRLPPRRARAPAHDRLRRAPRATPRSAAAPASPAAVRAAAAPAPQPGAPRRALPPRRAQRRQPGPVPRRPAMKVALLAMEAA